MTRRSIFRSLLGLLAAPFVAKAAAEIVAAPTPSASAINIPTVWTSTDMTRFPTTVTWTFSGNAQKTPCFASRNGHYIFRGYTEDMDCPFPPEPWP